MYVTTKNKNPAITKDRKVSHYMSMAYCKTAVSPLLTYWRYCSLAQSHRCDQAGFMSTEPGNVYDHYGWANKGHLWRGSRVDGIAEMEESKINSPTSFDGYALDKNHSDNQLPLLAGIYHFLKLPKSNWSSQLKSFFDTYVKWERFCDKCAYVLIL